MSSSSLHSGDPRTTQAGEGRSSSLDDGAVPAATASDTAYTLTLSILIFRGYPQDTEESRRLDFYIVADDEDHTNRNIRLDHQKGGYQVRELPDLGPPHLQEHYLRNLHVTTLQTTSVQDPSLLNVIRSVPIQTDEPGNVNLHWVGEVIGGLQAAGYIQPGDDEQILDAVIKQLNDAPDE